MRFGDFLRVVFVSASASIVSAVGCLVVVVFNCVFVFVFVCVSVFVFFFVFSLVFLPPSLLPLHPLSSSCLYGSSSPSSLQLFFSDTFEPRIHPIQTKNNNNKPITKMVAAIAVPKMSYKDMIVEAIVSLKERGGSSRQAIKKYIQSNHSLSNFDNHFNNALKKGVTAGIFAQPKGPVGPVKVVKEKLEPAKKEKTKTTKKVAKKPVGTKAKKELKTPTAKKTASKAAPKKATKVTKATKKAPTKVTKAAPKKATKTTKATKTSKTSKVAPKKAVTKAKKETAKKAAPKKTGKAAKK